MTFTGITLKFIISEPLENTEIMNFRVMPVMALEFCSLTLEFCRNQNKDISILTETHIKHDQIHHIRNNWLGPIFFSHKRIACPSLEGITEVDNDPKGRFVSFRVTPSIDRVLCVYAPLGYSTREQLARRRFFEGFQNYIEKRMSKMKTN